MKRLAARSLVLLVLLACGETPTQDPLDAPLLAILDAAHGGGNEHFFWLPPMVGNPGSFKGAFDGALSPVVRICDLADCESNVIAEYTTTTGPGSETVRIVPEDEHYIVNWHTGDDGLDASKTYRVSVLVDGGVLGYADVDVVNSGKELKNVDTGEYVALKDGRTLPIRFRIEVGIVGAVLVTPASALITDDETQEYTATVTDLHGALLSAVSVDWGISDPAVATLAPASGTTNSSGEHLATATPAGTLDTPTTITATSQGVAGTAIIEVEAAVSGPGGTVDVVGVEGGMVVSGGGVATLEIPPGALQSPVAITTQVLSLADVPNDRVLDMGDGTFEPFDPDGDLIEGTIVEFGPAGLTFDVPVTLTISYDEANLPAGSSEDELMMVRSEDEGSVWTMVDNATLDDQANTVSAEIDGFTTFSLDPWNKKVRWKFAETGFLHSCGVTTDEIAYCWGLGTDGQLGNGTTVNVNFAVPVAGGRRFASVSPGESHTCGLTTGGAAYCWGSGLIGQLGTGADANSNVPVPVSEGLTFSSVSAGATHTCGVTTGGVAYCWGNGFRGALGRGNNLQPSNVPVPVLGAFGVGDALTFSSVSAGAFQSCGVTTGGIPFCWGDGSVGQLGNSFNLMARTPVPVLIPL